MSVAAAIVRVESPEDELDLLRINLRHWRETSRLAFRYMPAALWSEAIVAARKFGVGRVASEVGLNLEDLKKRVNPGATEPEPPPAAPSELECCELPGILMPPSPPAAPVPCATVPSEAAPERAADEAWIEVLAADGAKLTLRLPVASLTVATALVQDFRRRA